MKDDRINKDLYDRVEVASTASDGFVSPATQQDVMEFDIAHRMGLSPRRKREKDRLKSHVLDFDLEVAASGLDSTLQEPHDAAEKLRMKEEEASSQPSPVVEDDRFRINGIAVDQDIRGGPKPRWRYTYQILFQSSTPSGQRVALALLIFVSLSVTCAVLDSVKSIRDEYGDYLLALEIFFTIVFSFEYMLRVACLKNPRRYMLSLVGIIDLCALVPTYMGFIIPSARPLVHLAVLRIFRVMRVFRVLRLARFVDAAAALSDNIQANKRRILVFLVGLFTLILVIGCAMYLIEGDRNGFSNIPISLYWTVVTITTVGYGDIAPVTVLGRMLATVVMFAGYGIIACPLVLNQSGSQDILTEVIECPGCFRRMHQEDANFCRVCGTALRQPRVKTIKARCDRLRLRGLDLERESSSASTPGLRGASSTVSTARSSASLLADETMSRDEHSDRKTVL